ncbi:hypothetical protein KPH14_006010 [Odynerus spinipes]|uniref:Androglobin n=1 Tax=Odynerus spinipes TaxID=1348599 RepID=A0AAD9RJM0_9HYME|nr:hypothetical protein KPH14_006010 [Odynerus spinipes]
MSFRSRKLADSDFNVDSHRSVSIRWPEWTDAELNNEKWALPKNSEDGLFQDMESTPMPPSLEPYEWIRARYLKDITFVRWFISSVMNLRYCGKNGLEVSQESEKFFWNGRQECWQGWMYIYSNNKAGRGAHRPVVNPHGKYVVRLYFLGCWRRVVVDDLMPVDKDGNPLLPCTVNNSELWPMLLAKALLKIASLSWTQRREIVDFNPIVCLTGWICLPLSVMHLSPRDKWEFLLKYAEHFEWTNKELKSENEAERDEKKEKSTQKKKKGKSGVKGLKLPDKPRPITLFLDLEDMKGVTLETVPGLSPCWSHSVHVVQSRDLPLDPKDVKPPLAKWKEHRWINWAIDRGLLDPVEHFVPMRCLKIVSALRKCKDQMPKTSVHRESDRERDTRKRKESQNASTKKTKEVVLDEIDFWVDFNKIAPYVKIIYLFYKPEYFEYTLRISDSYGLDDRRRNVSAKEMKKGSKKSAPSEIVFIDHSKFINTCSWPRSTERSRNESLYLFCDSVEEKFCLINFSTVSFSRLLPNSEEIGDPTSVRSSLGEASYLVIERHSWFFRPSEADSLMSTSTSGNKSSVLELEPGRHLLRIYCRSESPCYASISSDTIFHVGDRFRMHGLMITESERIDIIAKNISNSIAKAFVSFGSKDSSSSMSTFYRSYMPDLSNVSETKDRVLFKQIHEYFIEELVQLIRKIFPSKDIPDVLFALRTFFLNPTIGLERHDTSLIVLKTFKEISVPSLKLLPYDRVPSSNGHDSGESIEGEMIWIDYDRAASLIQSFFKMVVVKRCKERHDASHKDHSRILTTLMSIAELFDYSKSESLANLLLRNVLWKNDKFSEVYPCFGDFQYVLQVQECKGILSNIKAEQWIPVTRLIINAPENETIFGAIQLFTNLPSYHLRVFDNETGQEMLRLVNNVAPSNYPHTKLGYTLFSYGWSDSQRPRDTDWVLHFLIMKGKPMFYQLGDGEPISVNTRIPLLMIEESSNTYIPNPLNIISKWIVNITRDTVLSFRLKTSYELVRTKLKIVDEKENILFEVEGGSVLCIPVLYLRFEPNDDEDLHTTYYVEASVLDNSWPLTDIEWSVVMEAKGKTGKLVRIKSSTASSLRIHKSETLKSKRASKLQVDQQQLEPPYWKFQAVIDADSGAEIIQDQRREKEIAAMKEAWAADDPERPQRGRDLREAFLNAHALPRSLSFELDARMSSKMMRYEEQESSLEFDVCGRLSTVRKSSIRTLKQPRSRSFGLPPLDLSIYERTDEKVMDRRVRSGSEQELLKEKRYVDVLDFFHSHDRFLRRLSDRTFKQVRKYEKSLNTHEENFSQRRAQLEEAYEIRTTYIASIKSTDKPKRVRG